MLPSPDEFAALVRDYPGIPDLPEPVTAVQAAVLVGITYNGILEAHRRAENARSRNAWCAGMMPEPVSREPLMWTVGALAGWRASPRPRGAGGGHPVTHDYDELLARAEAIALSVAPRRLTNNMLCQELGIGRITASKVLRLRQASG